MSSLLEDILDYLKTNSKITNPAVDGFENVMPESPDNLVSLIEYLGTSGFVDDTNNRSIQVNVRNKSYETARQKVWSIYNLFHTQDIEDRIVHLTSTRWAMFNCRSAPFKLREDEQKRTIFIFNMGVLTSNDT